jgi:septation ring formation regulator EzrA
MAEDYREVLNDLEQQVEKTEEEFEQVKGETSREKQQKAEELIKQIKGQIEFLEEQMEKQ